MDAPAGVWLMMVGRSVSFIWASSNPASRKSTDSQRGSKMESHTVSASRSSHHELGRNSPQPRRSNRNYKIEYTSALIVYKVQSQR